jgi:methylphosphotriester-DNA--protein-cysteine methyltransferase
MNDALLLTDRLCDLTELALQAHTTLENATVFAAAKAVEAEFGACERPLDEAVRDKVHAICATICAAIGYAPAHGKTNPQLIVCARTDIAALRQLLKRPAYLMPQDVDSRVAH